MAALWRACAPAKINLGLFVGGVRGDGRHELVSVMQSVSLCDDLELSEGGAGGEDAVLCDGVDGDNLALAALRAFRAATGWDAPPLTLRVRKRIPVAAGMGGGSADAACALRLAAAASGLGDDSLLLALGAKLGADVPAQVSPGRFLATGAGEAVEPLPPLELDLRVVVLPSARALSTAAVYERFDSLGALRSVEELQRLVERLRGGEMLLDNDLQDAARSLCPDVDVALEAMGGAGADAALVSGSGPTVLGLFLGADAELRAQEAARGLADVGALVVEPVDASFGRVVASQ